jgi:WD40 repeat protein
MINRPAQQRKLICSASLDETVRVWDVETGDEILTLAHGSALIGCCFSHSGLFVGTLAVDNVTRIFDVSGGSSSLVDDTSGRPPVMAGAVVGAAFRKLDNGQEVLVIAEVRPPNSLVLGREMYLPAPESKTV